MQSVMIVALGIAGMSFGWFVYSRFIATKIYQLDPDFVTPAHEFNDGVDYHPTNKYVLWGHHFTSVAGAAPIVGPAIAVYWGWVPAVLWVTVPFGQAHDTRANPSVLCPKRSSASVHVHCSWWLSSSYC
jgi:carbon starvation protein